MRENKQKYFFFRMLCGFFMGVSIIAPGVSTSVMAVMMGIYHDLISIISNPLKQFKKNFFFLLPMGIGAIISIVFFIKIFDFLFDNYPIQARLLFFGLVAGSLPAMFKNMKTAGFKRHYLLGLIGAFLIAGTVALFTQLRVESIIDASNVSILYLCIAGAVSGVASMMPGMSVSAILILFGVYDYLLSTASGFTSNIMHTASIMLPIGVCFIISMVLFSKVAKLVFEKYNNLAQYMIFGFMCGTLIAIFPNAVPTTIGGWVGCAAMLVAGVFVSSLFRFLGKKFNVDEVKEETETEIKNESTEEDIKCENIED